MCGITGLFSERLRGHGAQARQITAEMTERLRHRGPDSDGVWIDDDAGLALGHRRLAIVDLSPEGHQPMLSPGGRYMIAYNGEIYNFRSLRAELQALGCTFRGHSDTEILLTLIEEIGLRPALSRLAGMFAFALWDRKERRLHLVRDRIGKKPLYFGWVGDDFVFASELKAIAAHPDFDPIVDRDALAVYFRHQYVPAPWSIWRGIHKLPAGSILSLDLDRDIGAQRRQMLGRIQDYWSVKSVAEEGAVHPIDLPSDALLDQLESTLSLAVEERMVADVPIGAFLSGGIDSSVVVALMQRQSSRPVKTFSIGFEESFYDEAQAARRVAAHLGTEHHELVLSAADTLASVPRLSEIFDEPLADPSAVPTFHVARLARQDVTVCLSGDGGDEIFAGYGRYALADRLGRRVETLPGWLRSSLANGIRQIPVGAWDAALRWLPAGIDGLRGGHSGDRMRKLADLLTSDDRDELYRALLSLTSSPTEWVVGGLEAETGFTRPSLQPSVADPVRRMMYFDSITYLPDDILVKVDRASMAVSLEARAPLLDHRVIELAWRMPTKMLRRNGVGKWPLRQLFNRYLPAELGARPKQGFGMPVGEWLRGPLRDWAEALLDRRRLDEEGFLRPQPIREMWDQHLSGARNFGTHLWTIATFQAWKERWLAAPDERQQSRAA